MLHLPPEMRKLLLEHDIQLVRVHTAEYKIDNRSVHDVLDWKDTDLYPCVKQHKSKKGGRGAFNAILSR